MKINIYKENLLIIFTSLPIDKTCCLGLIERKPEADSSQYTIHTQPVHNTLSIHNPSTIRVNQDTNHLALNVTKGHHVELVYS